MGLFKDDFGRWDSYSQLMGEFPEHLILTIETKDPIEVGAFVHQFTSLANQYGKYIRESHPDLSDDAEIFVSQVSEGSIIAELVPQHLLPVAGILAAGGAAITAMHGSMVLEDFVKRWGARIGRYFRRGGRDITASKSDLRDFHGAMVAIANDPSASAKLEAAYFEDGQKKIRAAFKFTTQEARQAEEEISNHKLELDQSDTADHERALMTFVRPDIRASETGKRSGELALIEAISDKPRPLIYASAMAEQRIKYEMQDRDNIFKKGFVVDVNVELRRGKPVAYRITNLHQVIDLPEDGED